MATTDKLKPQFAILVELALQGLADLYDEEQALFAFYVKGGRRVPMPLGWSICYTAIVLLGLNRARPNGWQDTSISRDISKALESLVGNSKRAQRFGHLGLIQWVNAECLGQYAKGVTDEIGRRSSVDNLLRLPTTELAWLLMGLCATYQHLCTDDAIRQLAGLYHAAIAGNFIEQTGLFVHTAQKSGPFDLRWPIGNFADQIYAIAALATYYEIFNDEGALQRALRCADCLCSLQGDEGQWWWHYHARRGGVVARYPVFAVHQHGMGPMGFRKLTMVSGKDYELPIRKGLDWLFGSNELGVGMVDWQRHVIWRDIERTFPASLTRYVSMLVAEAGLRKPIGLLESAYALRVNREMRPYELGWLLYGLEDQSKF
jgi:hypothetical protein